MSNRVDSIKQDKIDTVYRMVMWGESRQAVFEYLAKEGVGDQDSLQLYNSFFKERLAIIRKKYIWRTILGLIILMMGVGALWFVIDMYNRAPHAPHPYQGKGIGIVFGFSVFVLLTGVHFFFGGLVKLLMAKSNTGSIAGDF